MGAPREGETERRIIEARLAAEHALFIEATACEIAEKLMRSSGADKATILSRVLELLGGDGC